MVSLSEYTTLTLCLTAGVQSKTSPAVDGPVWATVFSKLGFIEKLLSGGDVLPKWPEVTLNPPSLRFAKKPMVVRRLFPSSIYVRAFTRNLITWWKAFGGQVLRIDRADEVFPRFSLKQPDGMVSYLGIMGPMAALRTAIVEARYLKNKSQLLWERAWPCSKHEAPYRKKRVATMKKDEIGRLMVDIIVPAAIAFAWLVFGYIAYLCLRNVGMTRSGAIDPSIGIGFIATALLFALLLALPPAKIKPTPEGIAFNDKAIQRLAGVSERLLSLLNPDRQSLSDESIYKELESQIYGHPLSLHDPYCDSLTTMQSYLVCFISAAKCNAQTMRGIDWDEAIVILRQLAADIKVRQTITDARVHRIAHPRLSDRLLARFR